jgi:murein L,D-transpeptidase YcbB/YkuD
MKILFKLLLFIVVVLPFQLKAQNTIADAINQHKANLHYPLSVERFYHQEGFKLIWLTDTIKTPAWDAMILLDCVSQYGLNPDDYYPHELTYDNLHIMLTGNISESKKAYFDIRLTDAMLTLINNLYYGKLNPWFPRAKIDANNPTQFKADIALENALEQKDVKSAILNVQPHSEAYVNLQRYIALLITKYNGITRPKTENDIRKIAINMERLRWINTTGRQVHLTCAVKEGIVIYY